VVARSTPRVEGTVLVGLPDAAPSVAVGSPEWYAWLEEATSFAFAGTASGFTARKERGGQRGWYWKAYRKRGGRLHHAYLGKSADLSLDRLRAVAAELAQRPAAAPPPSTPRLEHTPPSAAAPLLAAKLSVPGHPARLVERPSLAERLRAGLEGKLTLIVAPAGFGKTTLLSAWRASPAGSVTPLAWVALDAADSEPRRFWSYVLAAIDTLQPTLAADALALLQSPQPPPIDAVLTTLLNALGRLPADAVLVLDDYHLIDDPAIHHALAFLLDHLPPQLHLAITTRADPPLPLARLRARQQLTELRASDLRFTQDEAASFLTELMGLPLSAGDVATLEARTEGWVAGLQFAALAMRNRSDLAGFIQAFSGSHRFVVDYLAEEVVNRLPAHLRSFVLQTSVLERLCGPLCDAVLGFDQRDAQSQFAGGAYSQLLLEELERANLFLVALDDERRWYRYHHLFADALRARLYGGASAGEVARLYQRAVAWYEQAELIDEAVRMAFQGQAHGHTAELIERHARTIILAKGDVLQVRGWLDRLPQALILERPRLALIAGLTLTLTAQFAAAEQLIRAAAPAFDAPELGPSLRGELIALRATLARFQGDHAASQAHARQALALLAPDDHATRAGAYLNIGVAALAQADVAAAQSALAEAAALGERAASLWVAQAALEELMSLQGRMGRLRQVFETAGQAAQLSGRLRGQALPAAGMGLVGSAEVLYEWNDLAGAEQAAARATQLLRGSVERLLKVRGALVLARVCQARGEHADALAVVERCEAWFAQTGIAAPVALAWLAAERARLWVRQGELAAAARWEQGCGFAADGELGCVQRLALVWLRLAQGRHDASATLAELLPALEAAGWRRYLAEALLAQALLAQAQGDRSAAHAALQRALALAEPENYIRLFVDAGAPVERLLVEASGELADSPAQPAPLGYVTRLLEAFPTEAQGRAPPAHGRTRTQMRAGPGLLIEPLSAREIEILRLIADGHSNQAIAERLVLAVGTVKKHINNLFGKLDVQSRTQALARARELNLL
jgi:LuxR family transcriptional regulator, maltose regulon positive regulatory protein